MFEAIEFETDSNLTLNKARQCIRFQSSKEEAGGHKAYRYIAYRYPPSDNTEAGLSQPWELTVRPTKRTVRVDEGTEMNEDRRVAASILDLMIKSWAKRLLCEPVPEVLLEVRGGDLIVANFSSPHTFEFVDGTVLGACSKERALLLEAEKQEVADRKPAYNLNRQGRQVTDVWPVFTLGEAVLEEAGRMRELWRDGCLDVALTPLLVMTALKAAWGGEKLRHSPFRTIVTADRIKKTIYADKFGCV